MTWLNMLLVVAAAVQVVFWGWLFLERALLRLIGTRLKSTTLPLVLLAFAGTLLNVPILRGTIHWARTEGIGDPTGRRLVAGLCLLAVVVVGLFRVRGKEWLLEDSQLPVFWKAKRLSYILVLPLFIVSVLDIPVQATNESLWVATRFHDLVRLPVLGTVAGGAAILLLVIASVASTIGLFVLKGPKSTKGQNRLAER